MSTIELLWLAERAQECRLIVEVGSYLGRSARSMADNLPEGGALWCVDTWLPSSDFEAVVPAEALFDTFAANMGDWMNVKVGALRMGSSEAARHFPPHHADMVFIDADHSYEAVRADILAWQGIVRPGGVLAGHDYHADNWPGVTQAVDELVSQRQLVANTAIWWATL